MAQGELIRQRPPLNVPARATGGDERWRVAGLCVGLAAVTLAVFGQTAGFGFVNFDDDVYVYDNAKVAGGLSLKGLAWVFTHADCHLYHPLTMLSLMGDYQLHGLQAGGYHFTNVVLHTASVLLLFLSLRRMTGALWRSAFVAAVFATHPLRVESVAWVAERKDVLATFFFMLTIGAYARYVECRMRNAEPGDAQHATRNMQHASHYYVLCLFIFALGLLSKPTVVTLPFVLLLLDYWPLRRLFVPPLHHSTTPPLRLLLEKLPLLALAAGACALTVLAEGEAIAARANVSLPLRLGNALVSYAVYLRQMVWPTGLAPFYPEPEKGYSLWTIAFSSLLLALITGGVLAFGRKRRWLLTGWLWYLGMLTPMIGLVQVSAFAHADRMTYLPQIGLYLLLTWAAAELSAGWPGRRVALGGLAAIILGGLTFCARTQTAYWRDNETLWTHALACTTDNDVANNNFGFALFQKGRVNEAITYFQNALQRQPGNAQARNNLGSALFQKGRVDEAITCFHQALQIKPDYAEAHYNLGVALLQKGSVDEAIAQYQKALQIKPDYADAHVNLGLAFLQRGSLDEAITHYREALQIKPDHANAHNNLGLALFRKGNVDEAIGHLQKALQSEPDSANFHVNLATALLRKERVDEAIGHLQKALTNKADYADAHYGLGNAFLQKGSMAEAITHYQKALQIKPIYPEVQNNLAWLLATGAEASLRDGQKAVELARQANELTGGKNPVILHTLAAALAETGRFDDARRAVQKAIELAPAAGRQDLAGQLNDELKRYEAGLPLHQ
jgi:tetratricopeptide (TPR) repeat protein